MNAVYRLLDGARDKIRKVMHRVAIVVNDISRGSLTPDSVTIVGLLGHVPIAYLIATHRFFWAAILLIIFGLFDTLDGELARLQGKSSNAGMLLDASTDRFKEVILFTAIAYSLVNNSQPNFAIWAVAACGASLCVSYIKAKGETAIKSSSLTPNQINRLFQDGLLRFEVRMSLLILGLLTNQLGWTVVLIALLASITAVQRLVAIRQRLRD
ncbi:MAG: CDP-alcohol phosphatidyltransferase family protein [Candidatus Saccharimonadales bacterium]